MTRTTKISKRPSVLDDYVISILEYKFLQPYNEKCLTYVWDLYMAKKPRDLEIEHCLKYSNTVMYIKENNRE